jgi:endo-1,4-beta-xylanase
MMVRRFITRLTALSLALVGMLLVISARPAQEGLRDRAAARDFYFGAAVEMKPFESEDEYRDILTREFNMIVAENAFKFDAIHPERDRYHFADADALVAFAAEKGMKLRGHTLVWHRQLPSWITDGNFSRSEAIEILRDHIQTIVGRYRGKVWAWDVVNEAVDISRDERQGSLRQDSFWYRTIGPEYIKLAFEYAREADPSAILYYNDFDNEGMDDKSKAVYKLLSDLKRNNVPVDGVGWQMHLVTGFKIKNEHRQNASRLAELGVELSITELDVRMKMPPPSGAYLKQAESYRDVARFCLATPNCRALVLWGFSDKHSWIPGFFPGEGDALIYDRDYRAKPAYTAIRESLQTATLARPIINEAMIDGSDLVLVGEMFDRNATVFLNWRPQKSASAKVPDGMGLVIRGAAKAIAPGDTIRLQVQSGDGKLSPEFRFTR